MSPTDGATVDAGFAVTVQATEDVGVDRVELEIDGQPAGSDNAAPYEFTTDSALAPGSHTIKATAYDNAGDDLVRYKDSTCPSALGTGWYCHRNAWKNSTQTVMWTFTR